MKIEPTEFNGLLILEPKVFVDNRGYFMESYKASALADLGINVQFVQDNQSSSRKGVVRGLHFQNAPHAQTKLIRVLRGSILDVVVDLRKREPTFGKHHSLELSAENRRQFLIPKGFAHGILVLSDFAEILYKCDEYYYPDFEQGILFNDPALNIQWPFASSELILSEKDKKLPPMKEANFNF